MTDGIGRFLITTWSASSRRSRVEMGIRAEYPPGGMRELVRRLQTASRGVMMSTFQPLRGVLLSSLTLSSWSVASAEVAAPESVDEIVVTAQKRPELIQNVSAQVDVLT